MDIALRRVKALVSPRQYQIFSCYVIKGWDPEKVKKELGVNAAQVYLAKHRVGRILKREAAKLMEQDQ
jgi:RNA polymerase sigma-70 factor (ECF subfamily)